MKSLFLKNQESKLYTKNQVRRKLAGFPRWINGLFKTFTLEHTKEVNQKIPQYYFKGYKNQIAWGSPHYFNVNAARFDLLREGFKHHSDFFDVMTKNGCEYFIDEEGVTKLLELNS